MRSKLPCLVAAFSVLLASVAVTAILALKNAGIPETGFNYEPILEGWEVKELPIGPNEFLEEITEEILGFSYCRNFRFQRRSECFEVFLAFWDKGNVSEREVAGHTPEICYTRQGLNLDRKSEISNRTIDIPMWLLEFSHRGGALSLVYSHLADNRVVKHGRSGSPEFGTYLKRLLSGELNFKKRQLLVRLTFPCSSMPAESVRNHPEMERLIADILTAYQWAPTAPEFSYQNSVGTLATVLRNATHGTASGNVCLQQQVPGFGKLESGFFIQPSAFFLLP